MKLVSEPEQLKPRRFVIKHDEQVGYYLYVYEKERCIRDHLQESLDMAVQLALDDYQVPTESWKRVDQ